MTKLQREFFERRVAELKATTYSVQVPLVQKRSAQVQTINEMIDMKRASVVASLESNMEYTLPTLTAELALLLAERQSIGGI